MDWKGIEKWFLKGERPTSRKEATAARSTRGILAFQGCCPIQPLGAVFAF
jgi:hypothetical protein